MQSKIIDPSHQYGYILSHPPPGEEVVITGISGTFPSSANMDEFQQNLFNNICMIKDSKVRWKSDHPDLPKHCGIIPNIWDFDAAFFGLHYKQAMTIDPLSRIGLEKAYEAITDAGINPEELRGSRTSVFVGNGGSDYEALSFLDEPPPIGFNGIARSIFAQRISYGLGLKGTSTQYDTACSSSLFVLDEAYKAIRNGRCDNAIVVGCQTDLLPGTAVQFNRLGVLNNDGVVKSFDKDANGFTRAEAVGVILVQKAKDAKRIYAEVVHVKSNSNGFSPEGIFSPLLSAQENLMRDAYAECLVDRSDIRYFEAHGTATKAGDTAETSSIGRLFCRNRKNLLYIGSVKSNMGHSESAAGICSLAKAAIILNTGLIPPNLNYNSPRPEIEGYVREGKLQVVTESTKFPGKYIAVNSFGFGGSNTHAVLKRNMKEKINSGLPDDDLPRLVCFSGRTLEAVECFANDLISKPLDVEYIRLIQDVFKYDIDGHSFRAYTILTKTKMIATKTLQIAESKQPICFVFGGLKSQWIGIGASLMNISLFAETINKIDDVLSTKGINIAKAILNKRRIMDDYFEEPLGIIAVQMALFDLLKALKIEPDYVIGHSIGEIVCAYADNCLTLEQAISCAYQIGQTKTQSELNGRLRAIITSPKKRSSKWLPPSNAELPETCSADSLTETLFGAFAPNRRIPKNSVFVEIVPHFYLQELLKSSFRNDLSIVPLVDNGCYNPIQVLAKTIGELYLRGCNPWVENLYPHVTYPVSRGTAMISPIIKWNYKYKWCDVIEDANRLEKSKRTSTVLISASEEKMKYITGHVVDGRNLFPATGYLDLVCQNFGDKKSVIFTNVKFLRATNFPTADDAKTVLTVMIENGSGNFEITESEELVVTGTVRAVSNAQIEEEMIDLPHSVRTIKKDAIVLSEDDVYKELRLRGYNYRELFRGIKSCNIDESRADLRWNNYVTFMDTMMQMQIIHEDSRLLFLPTGCDKIVINYKKHEEIIENLREDETIPAYFYKHLNIVKAGGIEIHGVKANTVPRRKPLGDPLLESYKFMPNVADNLTLEESVRIIIQIGYENVPNFHIRTVEVLDDDVDIEKTSLLSPLILSVLGDLPLVQAHVNLITKRTMDLNDVTISDVKLNEEKDCLFAIVTNATHNKQKLNDAMGVLVEGGFIVSRENNISPNEIDGLEIIIEHKFENETIYLLKKSSKKDFKSAVDLSGSSGRFDWIPALKKAVGKDPSTVIFAQGDDLNGIIGMVNCLRKEPGKDGICCVHIVDKDAPRFDLENDFYAKQLRKGLAVNVFKNGSWGTYRHSLLKQPDGIPSEHAYVNNSVAGDLSSLCWMKGNLRSDMNLPGSTRSLIHIYYAALNFRDIMFSTGRLSPIFSTKHRLHQSILIGFEYAGRLRNGIRVMGMTTRSAISNLTYAPRDLMWEVPDKWSLEDAATVPVIYSTVLYCFLVCGKIEKGQSVLIHAGSGGVGQAAINIALYHGLKVYTTVGTEEKRNFIKSTWPEIKDNQIGNSRDSSFEQMIHRETNGRGVDYVLNSLSEEKLLASVRCLANGGKFLEIGKFDITNDSPIALNFIKRGTSFHSCQLDFLVKLNSRAAAILQKLLAEGLHNGSIKPIVRKVFAKEEVEAAFRFMGAGKHIGKILIKIREEEQGKVVAPEKYIINAVPRYIPSATGSYIISGGLGGFGLELADWLVLRGVRNLVLTSRKGISSGYQSFRINVWRNYGVFVKISTMNITTFNGCKKLIEEATELGPVEGIFNLAMVLKDAVFENQTAETFDTAFGPKAVATKHLDHLSRKLCPDLKCFVVFSSVVCGKGNAGQTNYGMANSIMEKICEQRKKDGYPAVAIQWGAVGDVGFVAEKQENYFDEISGTLLQGISNCLSLMDQFLTQPDPIVASIVVAEKQSTSQGGGSIVEAVANILGIRDLKIISFQATLPDIGMDSITGVEIKRVIERELEMQISPKDMKALTFEKLQQMAGKKNDERNSDINVAATEYDKTDVFVRLLGNDDEEGKIVVRLPSLATHSTKRKCIFIPGMEGIAFVMAPIAKNLDAVVNCLQISSLVREPEIPKIAQLLYKEYVRTMDLADDNFTIVGHSFGTLLALELAALLEQDGKVGDLVLLDGSPDFLTETSKQSFGTDDEHKIRERVLDFIGFSFLQTEKVEPTLRELKNHSSFEEKVKVLYDNKAKYVTMSYEYVLKSITTTCIRLKSMARYVPGFAKLKSRIKLLKPARPVIVYPAEDYSLSKYTESPVDIAAVPGDHFTMLDYEECSEEVNAVLRDKN